MRRAMRTEGIPYALSWRGPRTRPRPLVMLCDISGSMAPYTRMMLHFLHILRREVGQAEVFLFGTQLTRITRQLKLRDVDVALAEVSSRVSDWSGGTRTGEALRTFNTQVGAPRAGPGGGGLHHQRWVGPGRSLAAGGRIDPPPEDVVQAYLAQSAAWPIGLQAAHQGHGGCPSIH